MFDWNDTARHFLKTWLPHTCASDAASPTDIMTAPGGIGWGWLLRQQRAVPSIHTYHSPSVRMQQQLTYTSSYELSFSFCLSFC